MGRLRPAPAARYIHPKAAAIVDQKGHHDADLDVTSENAPNYLSRVAEICTRHLGHRVLEVGAGIGAVTAHYADRREVVANDVCPACVRCASGNVRRYFEALDVSATERHTTWTNYGCTFGSSDEPFRASPRQRATVCVSGRGRAVRPSRAAAS
jgi:hypothetical protein